MKAKSQGNDKKKIQFPMRINTITEDIPKTICCMNSQAESMKIFICLKYYIKNTQIINNEQFP